jgi:DNA-binding beta-propeller fold protein YncE
VVKLDSQGNFVLAWGSSGEGEEQFMETNRIACDSQDNVYVVDTSLNRIQKFDSNGNFIRSWNLPGGGFGLTIDSQDFVYVAGEYFLKYNANGSFIKEWGTPLTDDGRLSGPHGLTVDSLDALYLTEIGVARVQKFNSDGVFITEFGSDRGQGQLKVPGFLPIDVDYQPCSFLFIFL